MTRIRYRLRLVSLVAVLGAAACASAPNGGSGGSSNVLTREDVDASEAGNLYDAINQLRPRWLTVRASRSLGLTTEIVVYQDLTYLGNPEVLRQLSPNMVARIRYLDGATATASLPGLGSRHVEGAIVIETR
jgi:hypothetical protein